MRQRSLQILEKETRVTSRVTAVDPVALREDDTRYRELVDHLHSAVVVYEAAAGGEDFIIRDFNPAAARLEQTIPQAVIGRPVTEAFPGVREFGLLDVLRRVYKTGRAEDHPTALYQDDRLSSWRENYVYRLPSGAVVAVYDDVTERKQAEESLSMYRLLAAEARDIMLFVRATDGAVVEANAAAEAAYGYSREELLRLDIDSLRPAAQGPAIDRRLRAAGAAGVLFETEHRRKDGSIFPVEVSSRGTMMIDGQKVFLSVIRDTSERARAQQAAAERSHFLEELLEAIPVPVFYKDTTLRYEGCNEAFAKTLGCSKDEVIGKTVFDLSPASMAKQYDASDRELLAHPEKPVQREREILDPQGGTRFAVTHKAVFSDVTGTPAGIVGVNLDVTGIRQAERELAASAVQLRLTLKAAVAALGATAEMRDPYTAGHQRRVAELACAIAAKLGWQEGQIESLNTAALLHDIGKIVVPAEILSKPGRLTEIEMALIRQHATAGADAMADIDFEGAIAEMIRQHHERLDGSGYPAGLHDGEILPEARVLAVADVVEAMISHRPYRPALPIEEALAEIESGAGVRYDAKASAACLRLFRERAFTLDAWLAAAQPSAGSEPRHQLALVAVAG